MCMFFRSCFRYILPTLGIGLFCLQFTLKDPISITIGRNEPVPRNVFRVVERSVDKNQVSGLAEKKINNRHLQELEEARRENGEIDADDFSEVTTRTIEAETTTVVVETEPQMKFIVFPETDTNKPEQIDSEENGMVSNLNETNSMTFSSISYSNTYCVFPNIYKTEKRKDTITMLLHSSANYFGENLVTMSQKWDGQISFAVFASSNLYADTETDSSVENVIKRLNSLISCHSSLADSLDAHVFITANTSNCPEITVGISRSKCSDIPEHLDKFKYRTDTHMYPVNAARNVARKFHDSEYVLYADMEQEYSAEAEAKLRQMVEELDIRKNKMALTVRRFEYEIGKEPPSTMDDLRSMYGKDVFQFHAFFWPQGHSVPGVKKFIKGEETQIRIIDIKKTKTTYWEPMFVVHKSAPFHNEKIPYGRDNHVALALEMCCAGYVFPIARDVFNVHPGVRRKSSGRSLTYQAVKIGNRVLKEFYQDMLEKYPNTARKCLKWRLAKMKRTPNKN